MNPHIANTIKLIHLTTYFRQWYNENFEDRYHNSPYFFSMQQSLESNIDALATRIMPELATSSIQPPSIVSSSVPQTVPYTRTSSYPSSQSQIVPDIYDYPEDVYQTETSIPTEYDFDFGVTSASDSNRIGMCEMLTFIEEVINYFYDIEHLRPYAPQLLLSLSTSRVRYEQITTTLIDEDVFDPLGIPPYEDIHIFVRNMFHIYNEYSANNPSVNPNSLFITMFNAALRNTIEGN